MGYTPLTLNVMGGPYFLSSTNAVDLTRIREIDDQIAPPEIAQDNRFLNMFQQDGEVNNRESIEVNLPIWVPIVISVLVGFAMGLGKVFIISRGSERGSEMILSTGSPILNGPVFIVFGHFFSIRIE